MRVILVLPISDCSAHESWSSLSSLAELVSPRARSRSEFLDECRNGQLDGILVIYRTFDSVDITGRFDEELVKVLPGSVKFVCHNGERISHFSARCRIWSVLHASVA
jgi:D-3-phosphoglycerate dehydrogenase